MVRAFRKSPAPKTESRTRADDFLLSSTVLSSADSRQPLIERRPELATIYPNHTITLLKTTVQTEKSSLVTLVCRSVNLRKNAPKINAMCAINYYSFI